MCLSEGSVLWGVWGECPLGSVLWGWRCSRAGPSGVVTTAAPDPELMAMLARAAVRFPEVHEEVTKLWMAPFTARSRSSVSSVLTTLDGWAARGYACIPQVERVVTVHLCSRPKLIVLRAKQTLPCMPLLSCRFTKPRLSNRCMRVVPTRGWCRSCSLRATKVTARSLVKAMSTIVVQERYLWLKPERDEGCRQDMLSRRPHFPGGVVWRHRRGLCQAVLSGRAADRGDPAHPAPAWCTFHLPGNRPQSARRRGRPPASLKTALPNRHLGRCFFFCSAAGSRASGTHFFKERAISFSYGFSVPRDDSVRCIASSSQEGAVQRRSTSPCTSRQSHLRPREFCKDVSERAAFLYHPALLPFAAPAKRWSRLRGIWRRGSCCPAHLTGSHSQFDSAMGFSSPGDLPSSTAFSRLRWQSRTPLSCARRLLSSWQRMPVPPAEMRQGFYSPYFIVPKKGGGLWPILDLRVFNRALHKLPFKMLTHRRIIKCILPQDWVCSNRPEGRLPSCFDSSATQAIPTVCVRVPGMAVQGPPLLALPVSPCFKKVVVGALAPLREVGIRVLNYLDWLILAQSREQLCGHRDLVHRHLIQLGLWVNWEKSKLFPVQRISVWS